MIINPTDEAALQAKQVEQIKNEVRFGSVAAPSSSRQWSSLRNPRIVRVSRSFGGKDRHSKVCTIRGLRDRRIRLSVLTAVQLYDLQDKLGLTQPSKVIDWLLDVTKQDIDKLPPLQMPQGFSQFHQHPFGEPNGPRNLGDLLLLPHESSASGQFSQPSFYPSSTNSAFLSKRGIEIDDNMDGDGHEAARARALKHWDIELGLRAKDKEVLLHREPLDDEKCKSAEMNELQKHVRTGGNYAQLSAQNFFPVVGYSSSLTNNTMPHSYKQWDHSNLSLSQFGGFQPQTESFLHSNSSVSLHSSSSSSLSSGFPSGSQLYFCPATVPSLFPTYPPYPAASTENDTRQMNHFQLLSSSSSSKPILSTSSLMPPLHLMNQPVKLFHTNSNTEFLHPQDDTRSQDDDQQAN